MLKKHKVDMTNRQSMPLTVETITEIAKRRGYRQQQAQRLIAQLAEFLNAKDEYARQLWMALTALRGPDKAYDHAGLSYNRDQVKADTTEKIRFAFGLDPTTFGYAHVGSEFPSFDHTSYNGVYRQHPAADSHFIQHYSAAVNALVDLGILAVEDGKLVKKG